MVDDSKNSSDAIDVIIGDVAREMTAAAPGDGLARRVSVRIAEAEADRARRTWFRPWVLAPAAAACLLVLAVFVARDTRKPELRPPAPTIANTAPLVVAAPVKHQAPPETPKPIAASRRPAAVPAATLPADVAVAPLAFAPIDGIERIDLQPLARSEQIDINPIAINRIEIAAMR